MFLCYVSLAVLTKKPPFFSNIAIELWELFKYVYCLRLHLNEIPKFFCILFHSHRNVFDRNLLIALKVNFAKLVTTSNKKKTLFFSGDSKSQFSWLCRRKRIPNVELTHHYKLHAALKPSTLLCVRTSIQGLSGFFLYFLIVYVSFCTFYLLRVQLWMIIKWCITANHEQPIHWWMQTHNCSSGDECSTMYANWKENC